MMKILISFLLSMGAQAFAFAPNFDGRPELKLVIGVDKTAFADESPMHFPCTSFLGKVSCAQIKFENRNCADSLYYDRLVNKIELSCLVRLKKVVIGYADVRQYTAGTSHDRYGSYQVSLTNRVYLKHNLIILKESP